MRKGFSTNTDYQALLLMQKVFPHSGQHFFEEMVYNLSEFLDMEICLVGLRTKNNEIATLAFCVNGQLQENITYSLVGTPCEQGMTQGFTAYPENVFKQFPDDAFLAPYEAYAGNCVLDECNMPLGILAVVSKKPIEEESPVKALLQLFAQRVASELESMRRLEELEELTRELALAKLAAEKSNQNKSSFLTNVSHEIRTPMNAILGFSDLLRQAELPAREQRFLENISSSGKGLMKLINEILDLSKIEAGKIDICPKPVSLKNLLNTVSSLFLQSFENKGLRFSLDIQGGLPEAILLDGDRLQQVLINLLGNALKFTTQGDVRLRVKLEMNQGAAELHVFVEDSGCGVPEEKIDLLFEPFEQLHDTRNDEIKGTGLGLSISRNLVERMGGVLTAYPNKPRGMVFELMLKDLELTVPLETKQVEEIPAVQFEPARILIADDIAFNRELLQAYLEHGPFELAFAENGQEMLDVVPGFMPDLILLDMKMPVMDGFQAVKELRASGNLTLPVIAVTTAALLEDDSSVIPYCQCYLPKPLSMSRLWAELVKILPCELICVEEGVQREYDTQDLKELFEGFSLLCAEEYDIGALRLCRDSAEVFLIKIQSPELKEFTERFITAVDSFDIAAVEEVLGEWEVLEKTLHPKA